jgi:hypothetical protein
MRFRRTVPFAVVLASTLLAAGCNPVPRGEALHAAVDRALEAGDLTEARRLLDARPISDDPVAMRLLAELEIMSGRHREAQALLGALTADDTVRTLIFDACVGAALGDLEGSDAEGALAALAPCEGSGRLDVVALRLDAQSFGDVPPVEAFEAAVAALRAAPAGPETDVAASALESAALRTAAAQTDAGLRAEWLRRGFEVGRSPEVGPQLIAAIEAAGEAAMATDRQAAATWFEHLFTVRIEGLEVPDDVRARAEARSREALFPIFCENFTARYNRKALEDDIAAGIVVRETHAVVLPPEPAEARAERFNAFVYSRAERPRPFPTPNYLELHGVCADVATECVVSWDVVERTVYDFALVEERFAREAGVELRYEPGNEL